MTQPAVRPPGVAPSALLVMAILCATLTEAIAGTVLALARADIGGDTQATPDELAWLDIAYTAMKLLGFMVAPWLMTRLRPRALILGATLVMGVACLITALTVRMDLLVALRALQGFAGGSLLVAGQTLIFLVFAQRHQAVLQALFAIGAVVAPATLTPALDGWLLDQLSWTWIFLSIVPLALGATGLLLLTDDPMPHAVAPRPFDWPGVSLLATSLFCFSFVLSQGSRWNWFEEARILWSTMLGAAALLAFLGRQAMAGPKALLDFSLFRSDDFSFASLVSLVAGAALFGTAFLIPSFALSRLGFTPTAAGELLLPSGALFVGSLLLSAFLMQVRRVPPIATVPFGILMIMASMWMLSGSTGDSGARDMMAAVLLRGLGLGFLFLSITLVAFGDLPDHQLAAGIGLFNTGRQLGGLMGVAGLQTLIDHETATNITVLGAHISAGVPAVGERLTLSAAMLASKGLDAAAANALSASLLGSAVAGQSVVIAFDTAFNAIALFFLIAALVLIGFKAGLHRRSKARAARTLACPPQG
jgi:DHA2 family multidrug resistance protein